MSNKIKHSGVIESIAGDSVKVRILQTSACAACKVAGHCNASEAKEKLVDVYAVANAAQLAVGQPVVVSASRDVAGRALLLGFGLPFLLMMATLVVVSRFAQSEATAALAALAVLVPYYGVVWLLRDRIGQRIAFQLED